MRRWEVRIDQCLRDRRVVIVYLVMFLSLCLVGGLLEGKEGPLGR